MPHNAGAILSEIIKLKDQIEKESRRGIHDSGQTPQLSLKVRLAALEHRLRNSKKRRNTRRSSTKKGKRKPWPSPESMQSGKTPLIYSGAFEMNRRKH